MNPRLITRKMIEQNEDRMLAPYAMRSMHSKGRKHPEPEHEYRSVYQRDRDRIVHSRAFRRLEYKTQVFVNHEGDHYRTRLTHTLEVAMISRSIARSLGLNEDLVEALALVHDVGHPAFGHSGEHILNEMMKHHGGFEHNHQGLRIVELLEKKYPDFEGINLSWEVREGIIKHNCEYAKTIGHEYEPHTSPLLEVQVVNIADEIAYNSHDLDDGLSSGLFTTQDLRQLATWAEVEDSIRQKRNDLNDRMLAHYVVRGIIDTQVCDVLQQTQENLKRHNIESAEDVRSVNVPLVTFSPEVADKNKALKKYLYENLYTHHQVEIMNQKGLRIIRELFELFVSNPRLLDPDTHKRLDSNSLERVVCDYIAGMTDRYAFEQYRKLYSLSERYTI